MGTLATCAENFLSVKYLYYPLLSAAIEQLTILSEKD